MTSLACLYIPVKLFAVMQVQPLQFQNGESRKLNNAAEGCCLKQIYSRAYQFLASRAVNSLLQGAVGSPQETPSVLAQLPSIGHIHRIHSPAYKRQ